MAVRVVEQAHGGAAADGDPAAVRASRLLLGFVLAARATLIYGEGARLTTVQVTWSELWPSCAAERRGSAGDPAWPRCWARPRRALIPRRVRSLGT